MNVNLVKIVLQPVAVVSLCVGLSACAFDPPADPASPLATRIDSLVSANRDYPRWQYFPDAPVNVPDAASVRVAVSGLEASQGELAREVAAIDWELGDTEQFVTSIRQRLNADNVEIPTADTPAQIEAFVASLRERAKAPPPVDRPLR
ncbi:hypothetical protein [Brevundimonas sp.]|uniref:hypothetical protein n=1 Tax=Brevundimonas sp. TaxID=1871086 RepID=UPI0028A24681|nr:hypothetical protein [Brevundimonas sp.]